MASDVAIGPRLAEVMEVFHAVFAEEGVLLSGGHPEPFYLAPREGLPGEIRFTRNYLNSCLHEVAHWCIAGAERRARDDYGYWYSPDGRDAAAQEEFFRSESAPQALEWAFALACGADFRMSCDNLGGGAAAGEAFALALRARLDGWVVAGFPPRGARFLSALHARFQSTPAAPTSAIDTGAWLTARLAAEGLPR